MPVCEQCDGVKFYEEDGRFYCSSCHMQCEDKMVEHQQEVDQANYGEGTRTLKFKLKGEDGRRKRRKFKNNDLGISFFDGHFNPIVLIKCCSKVQINQIRGTLARPAPPPTNIRMSENDRKLQKITVNDIFFVGDGPLQLGSENRPSHAAVV